MNQNFETQLKKYAALIVATGINVKPGDTVVIQIAVDQAPLARLLTSESYRLGAAEVIVDWQDTTITRHLISQSDLTRLSAGPDYLKAKIDYWIAHKAKRISVMSADPQAFAKVDSNRLNTYQKALGQINQRLRSITQNNDVSWTVVAAASPEWAQLVFPDLATTEAVRALWTEIFKTTRVDQPDPVAAWQAHDTKLHRKAAWLNQMQFDALHYQAPGTDLTIGLPKNHIWEGASSANAQGEAFMANMPTEEVFTAPDHRRIDGTVHATKPLSYAGQMLTDLSFTFRNGQVTAATAKTGQEILDQLLQTDAGAKSLGEVALVPDPSPISQSGITFYNTLFDENASNHLALGAAYPFSIQNGTKMNPLELQAAGLNQSLIHVDFMVGSAHMNIDGITKTGKTMPIFKNGDWA
ncbi:aminopeptidase [Agrilactobacillus fermenti]|uniref:aminopeptidase n=1 Tax=Agrilactobacillus fermenti TaxID=2586909 RepID=UPI003A5C25C9